MMYNSCCAQSASPPEEYIPLNHQFWQFTVLLCVLYLPLVVVSSIKPRLPPQITTGSMQQTSSMRFGTSLLSLCLVYLHWDHLVTRVRVFITVWKSYNGNNFMLVIQKYMFSCVFIYAYTCHL